jgi:hypothetical protein
MKWKQKMLLGASLKIIAPTGQYDVSSHAKCNPRGGRRDT